MGLKILVVEDELPIQMGLNDLLTSEGYEVFIASDGEEALNLYFENAPNLLLLDIMIPKISGYDVCKKIRKNDSKVGIIMLSAKGEEIDKVVGLELGADDYIVKPFGVKELLARVRSNLRRIDSIEDQTTKIEALSFDKITIDSKKLLLYNGKKKFELSMREYNLLQYFIAHENEALSRNCILNKIWGIDYYGTTRTLDQYIVKLRKKIEKNPEKPQYIKTVHGIGYRFSK